jgi:hypothetical protein
MGSLYKLYQVSLDSLLYFLPVHPAICRSVECFLRSVSGMFLRNSCCHSVSHVPGCRGHDW